MERIKRLASLMLAMIMVLSMAMTVSATETTDLPSQGQTGNMTEANCDITLNNDKEGFTYTAYQIFSGDVYVEATGTDRPTLSNIDWGADVDGDAVIAVLKDLAIPERNGAKPFENVATAADVVAVLEAEADDNAVVQAFAEAISTTGTGTGFTYNNGKYTASNLAPGYYMVVDTTSDEVLGGTADPDTIQSRSRNILMVVGHTVATPKSSVIPIPDKEVGDGTTGEDPIYTVGSEIPYTLSATLPDAVGAADTYKLVFRDALSAGLDYVKNDVVVIVKNGEEEVTLDAADYTVAYSGDSDREMTITFVDETSDIKKLPATIVSGTVIMVKYKARLNENAVTGTDPITNKLILDYNHTGKDEQEGHTPEINVPVFSFNLVVNKKQPGATADADPVDLAGADFTLEKWDAVANNGAGAWVSAGTKSDVTDETVQFTFGGLDEGWYRLTESKTPAGFNTIEPVGFKIEAEIENPGTKDAVLTSVTATPIELNSDGDIVFENGEPKVLTGSKVTFSDAKDVTTGTDVTVTVKQFSTDILNQSGSLLPSTGGIGTTIFYVVGGILVLGAGLLLVTKRRMKSN